MSSIPQIGLGIVILGLAFILGHYVTEHTASRSEPAKQMLDDDEIVWQSNETIRKLNEQLEEAGGLPVAPAEAESDSSLPKSSMPIAGLGDRPVLRKPPSEPLATGLSNNRTAAPEVSESLPPLSQPQAAEPIVQPDFSALAARMGRQRNRQPVSGDAASGKQIPFTMKEPGPTSQEPGPASQTPALETAFHNQTKATPGKDVTGSFQNATATKPIPAEGLTELGEASKRKFRIQSDQFVTYRTRPGDTLQGISIRYFGKPDFYLDIYIANRETLSNPARVPANTVLKIPVYEPPRDPLPHNR